MLPHILSKVLWNEELLPGSPENFQSIPTNPVLFWANVQLWVALQVDGELGGFGMCVWAYDFMCMCMHIHT